MKGDLYEFDFIYGHEGEPYAKWRPARMCVSPSACWNNTHCGECYMNRLEVACPPCEVAKQPYYCRKCPIIDHLNQISPLAAGWIWALAVFLLISLCAIALLIYLLIKQNSNRSRSGSMISQMPVGIAEDQAATMSAMPLFGESRLVEDDTQASPYNIQAKAARGSSSGTKKNSANYNKNSQSRKATAKTKPQPSKSKTTGQSLKTKV